MPKPPKLKEIAARIAEHLKRFEADKAINVFADIETRRLKTSPYYMASAGVAGPYVWVRYVSYQTGTNLTKDEALKYLTWLDAGNVGKHYGVA